MSAPNLLNRNRATLKLLFVGALSLAMGIPLLMVRSIIDERQGMQYSAEQTIASRWGGSQTVSGLVALIQSPVTVNDKREMKTRSEWRANVLSGLTITASLTTEQRCKRTYTMRWP